MLFTVPWSQDCLIVLLVQSHRHELHKSHNKAAAQWELKEKALKRRLRHAGSPAPLDQASLSIIREVSTVLWEYIYICSVPDFSVSALHVYLYLFSGSYSVELNSVVWRCCRFSLISCCCRMCWPVLTKPWLWSKTCLEMLHAGTPVSGNLFCVQINRCSD